MSRGLLLLTSRDPVKRWRSLIFKFCDTLQRVHNFDTLKWRNLRPRCRLRIMKRFDFQSWKKKTPDDLCSIAAGSNVTSTQKGAEYPSDSQSASFIRNEIEINILIRASCRENWTGSNLWLPFGNESGGKMVQIPEKMINVNTKEVSVGRWSVAASRLHKNTSKFWQQ